MQLFNQIIEYALKNKTSDIHIGASYRPAIRLDGRVTFVKEFAEITEEQMSEIIKSIISEDQFKRLQKGEEIDCSFTFQDKARFRVNVYKERKGLNLALRYIPEVVPTLEELGLPEVLKQMLSKPYGLILVTGPTGSGKSSTLAAMIDHINKTTQQHIITIEDPIEYIYKNEKCLIKQREVGQDEDTVSFPKALRAALREDPDVLLVGEMRDKETMQLAITAAETGHLVLSTVHTNNTYQAINRIIDVFSAEQQNQIRTQLAQNLVGVVAQRLLPKKGGGRIAGLEILLSNSAVKSNIRDNKIQAIPNTIKTSRQDGMIMMEDYIAELVAKGVVEPDVAKRFTGSQAAY